MDKDLRDDRIIDLHNQGCSVRNIAIELNIGKTTVSNVINSFLGLDKIPSKKVIPVKLKGTEERFESFAGWNRLDVNEYVNDKTGEVVRVAYVKSGIDDVFGHFVKLGDIDEGVFDSEKKSNPADDVLKAIAGGIKPFKCGCWIDDKYQLRRAKDSLCNLYKSEHKR